MEMQLIPGYKDLFGELKHSYGEFVKGVPSHVIITFFIALNNELNATLPEIENQKRLRKIFSKNFSHKNLMVLESAFATFRDKAQGQYNNLVFGRRYLIAMILRELNDYRHFDFLDTNPDQEFNLLLAYFAIVDEVNDADQKIADTTYNEMKEDDLVMRLLWTPTINQYEFNDNTDVVYEIFKLLCLFSYVQRKYKPFLREYLNSLGFASISQYIGSVHQLALSTLNYQDEKVFKKLNFIRPFVESNQDYLIAQTINKSIGTSFLFFSDIKKKPLFFTQMGDYLVIDEDAYKKKIFRGPFFEIRALTTLKKQLDFNRYSGEISFEVSEKLCFRSIMRTLNSSNKSVMHFDDVLDNAPDCYYRDKKNIFLFEFKSYAFPIELTSNPNFNQIKEYIDKRFIISENGSSKGISQIKTQIEILSEKKMILIHNIIRSWQMIKLPFSQLFVIANFILVYLACANI